MWPVGGGDDSVYDECGAPASTRVWEQGTDLVRPVCHDHHAQAVAEGWATTGPELQWDEPAPNPHRPIALAEVDALVDAMHGAKGTADAKATHTRDNLAAAGWGLFRTDGGPVVVLRPGQEIVTVPDGHEIEFRRIAIDGPGDQLVDPELSELAEIVARLDGLNPDARERLVSYLDDRYCPAAYTTTVPGWQSVGPSVISMQLSPGRDDRSDTKGTA